MYVLELPKVSITPMKNITQKNTSNITIESIYNELQN